MELLLEPRFHCYPAAAPTARQHPVTRAAQLSRRPCGGLGQDLSGPAAVPVHLRLQGRRAVEAAVRANEVDEFHLDLASIEVAVEVEQEGFEDGGAVVESGPRAEVGGTRIMAAGRVDADGVDAVSQGRAGGKRDIGGGKA